MRYLTLANQLTILRIMLIPAFVLLTVYGYLGAALLVFLIAGVTDALDGLIARVTSQRTSLGAWLDPMADKLLLVTTFVVLTLPQVQLTNHVPLWLTVLIISRDIVIVGVVAIVNLCGRASNLPSLDAGESSRPPPTSSRASCSCITTGWRRHRRWSTRPSGPRWR